MILGLGIALLVIILDQVSKYVVFHYILSDASHQVIAPFFNLVSAWNTGVSFSMFNDGGWKGTVVLSLLALLIVAFLLRWLFREEQPLLQVALGMIIGGAIGNVIDRLWQGAVFDFLDFHVMGHHWPAFNVADSFICIGAVFIFSYEFLGKNIRLGKGK